MALRVTLIQGGGTGLDRIPVVKAVVEAVGVALEWDEHFAGWAAIEKGLPPLPEAMLASVRKNGVALKTKLLPPPGREEVGKKSAGNYNVQLRKELGLFATVRPVRNLPGLPARFQGVDMLVVREITEDLYTSIEHEIVPGVVQSIKVVTRAACDRFLKFAFGYAREKGRKEITCVHKANILKLADGLFVEAFRSAAQEHPEFKARELIVDNCCMQMVSRPTQFDVMVMGNLYGDLVSDLAAGVVGGVSTAHGLNFGDGIRVYESFHGGGRELVPENTANPVPELLSVCDLLEANGHAEAAGRILDAVGRVLVAREHLTGDLGGNATTSEMGQAIVAALRRA
jgi:isocitrate dehydrogenase (NAD+)